MKIKFKNKWIEFRYDRWANKHWFATYLIDGFIICYLKFAIICKTK